MEEFIENNYEAIYEGIIREWPDSKIACDHDLTLVDDIDLTEKYIYTFMYSDWEKWSKDNLTLDDQAREVIASSLKESSPEYQNFKDKKISKVAFLKTLDSAVDKFIQDHTIPDILETLKTNYPFFKFKPEVLIDALRDRDSVVVLAPILIRKEDSDSYSHILYSIDKNITDEEVYYPLSFDNKSFLSLLSLAEEKGYKTGGLSFSNSHVPQMLIVGKTSEDVAHLKEELRSLYGLRS